MPVHLLERIILMSTDEGDTVLDPFSGTGTSAIAAKRLGRNFIGFELDKEYADISENKLNQEESCSKIGKIWVSFYLNEIVTLRDKDWEELAKYYIIPDSAQDIDHTPVISMNGNNAGYVRKNKNSGFKELSLFDDI